MPFSFKEDNTAVYYSLMILILVGLFSEFLNIFRQLFLPIFCSKKAKNLGQISPDHIETSKIGDNSVPQFEGEKPSDENIVIQVKHKTSANQVIISQDAIDPEQASQEFLSPQLSSSKQMLKTDRFDFSAPFEIAEEVNIAVREKLKWSRGASRTLTNQGQKITTKNNCSD